MIAGLNSGLGSRVTCPHLLGLSSDFFLKERCEKRRKIGQPEKRRGKTTTGNGWTGLEFAKPQRAVENREKWRKLVVKSSMVPQRPHSPLLG